jgi:hypothetical protein
MNFAPKKHFIEKKQYAEQHRDLVVTHSFTEAVQAALLDQVMALPPTYSQDEAAAAYFRIIGARDFVHHLLNIAEHTKTLPDRLPANLDHSIR